MLQDVVGRHHALVLEQVDERRGDGGLARSGAREQAEGAGRLVSLCGCSGVVVAAVEFQPRPHFVELPRGPDAPLVELREVGPVRKRLQEELQL